MVPIEIERVRKRFGGVAAVDGVSLSIGKGELFFLLGPSGCGKTTLLRCIAGFCDVDEGAIRFDGRDITAVPAHRRNTGMVFQNYALWPHLTVAENVAFGLKERGVGRAERDRRVREALARVQMEPLASRKPNQLSGGQQQRVALARALVIEPDCLLLDEPLSNLDAQLRLEMREEIRALCKRAEMTAVYVTHDQKEALSVADRVAVLDRGRVRQVGAPRDIYRRPADTFVAGFIGETNLIPSRVVSVNGAEAVVECDFGRLRSTAFVAGLADGAKVRVSLRPESIRLGEAQAGASGFPAKIVHSVYLGELAQHRVVLGDRTDVKVFEMNPRWMASEGQPVHVQAWLDAADVVVLSA
ncbi:MAG: ABC transporter ATP-binding protein [Phycisphaerae bacterium]|nr:MAG: ABC transporter ATP-binding protein [Planctomycetota bacterium]KAB2944553.1 MAG: ABC transporter ATP-binding protein [Phycisphaerae bacterium]MBE7456031.1 ABC transporter ATP-binding protein [Planctomycetia bacterium]MCL4717289.1 ABC transporter ATP-binding protein [Phycisphaerae bacterium]MCQ3920005.1 spermidine/putrescine ABC transporter ATP-binding protein [Planctomycetota bacterium]